MALTFDEEIKLQTLKQEHKLALYEMQRTINREQLKHTKEVLAIELKIAEAGGVRR